MKDVQAKDQSPAFAAAVAKGIEVIIARNLEGVKAMIDQSEGKESLSFTAKVSSNNGQRIVEIDMKYGKPTKDKVVTAFDDNQTTFTFQSIEDAGRVQEEEEDSK